MTHTPHTHSVFFSYGVQGSGTWSESGVEGSSGAVSLRGPGVEGTWAAHNAEPVYFNKNSSGPKNTWSIIKVYHYFKICNNNRTQMAP